MASVLEENVRDRLLLFYMKIHATGDGRLKKMLRQFIRKERERLARLQDRDK